MTSIRKFWWAGLTLAAFVGCAEETQTTPSTPAATPGPAPTTPPGPAAKTDTPEPAKEADQKEMEKPESPPASAPKVDAPKVDAPKIDAPKPDADKKAESVKLNDEELAAIKKLPADEQPLALKQLICPVSDEHLGAMDTPIKVTAEGKTFFLCCKGCKKELDADAKAVLAKLKN
ncbi:MAG: hypothetical protein P4L84_09890 [Isosphaeraceae bacterium]|nr:hypothetical protein [Isosphaeraceae bacterium]